MATYNAVQIEHRENLKNKIFRQLDISKYFRFNLKKIFSFQFLYLYMLLLF